MLSEKEKELLELKDERKDFYFKVENTVIDEEVFDSVYEAHLFVILSRYCNNSQVAYPSLETLAKKCYCSKPTLIKAIKGLETKGYIKRVQRYDKEKNSYNTTVYTVKNIVDPVKQINKGSKRDLQGVVNDINKGSKGDLQGVVNDINKGSKGDLHKEEQYKNNNIKKNNIRSSSAKETPQPQLDEKSIEFRNDITELRDIIIQATGENPQTVDMVFKPVMYRDIIKPLLAKIKASKFLMGEKDIKPKLYTFVRQDRINEILAGLYDDFEKNKTAEVIPIDNLKDKARREKEQEEFERMLGL